MPTFRFVWYLPAFLPALAALWIALVAPLCR